MTAGADTRATWARRAPLWAALALTGFSALALQVVWQRLVVMHVGADVPATATVVAGFLAGLGIGNLVGGRMSPADVDLVSAASFAHHCAMAVAPGPGPRSPAAAGRRGQ